MGLNLAQIINKSVPVDSKNSLSTIDLAKIAESLPFARDLIPFTTEQSPVIVNGATGTDWDYGTGGFHWSRLFYNSEWGEKAWRMYYCAAGSDGIFTTGFAEAVEPDREWTKYANNPVLTATETWEDPTYATGGIDIVYANKRFEGFYQYIDLNGKYKTARALSVDGITWTDKTQVVFDDTVLSKFNQWCTLVSVIYEHMNGRYVGLIHGASTKSSMLGATVESTDGINWSYLGLIDYMRPRKADQNDIEPMDACQITKIGSVYVAFGHTWINSHPEGTTKPLWFAVSMDAKNWYVYPKHISLPNKEGAVYKYPYFISTHNAWYGAYIPSKEINLIKIDMNAPYSTGLFDSASIANGATLATKHYLKVGHAEKLQLSAGITYGSVLGDVKVKVYAVLLANGHGTTFEMDSEPFYEFTIPQTTINQSSRVTKVIENCPATVEVVVENSSGATITNVKCNAVFI